ncbi:TetR family transcriptional regulator [Asanoa ishikariensis]|uniref:Transcriptional regulator, TetR family n=1 Tax=Asanoa ishikariensis TaxID=137265 RepID=A0A1H3S2H6_9ACTN|nr:TetR/AcrR family transcriptional regulator [Asanoa ishikariensis]GIF66597.1 TetR family transcriptional regulator [Asanoa ishikariensis]SDZ31765.1 transcriptional regulator, TetR family [Asanoa ishikariensis]
MTSVKGKAPNRRTVKARETRTRMLDAARQLFVERGYGATTLADVAEAAGVAVQTIYFTFGNKRSLFKEMVDVTIAGDDEPVATMDRDWFQAGLDAPTAEGHLRTHVAGSARVLDRVAPIVQMVEQAAGTDPEIAGLWPDTNPRYTVQSTAARSLMAKPGARPDVSAADAADVLYAVLSPELYLLFVRDRGWSPERFEAWAASTLEPQLIAA